MDKITFPGSEETEASRQNAAEPDENLNRFMEIFLMPRLSELSKIVTAAGMKNELTLDRYGAAALNVHVGDGGEVAATFLKSEDENVPVMLSLTGLIKGADGEPEEKELVLFYEALADNAEGFSALLSVFAKGLKVLPDNEMLKEAAKNPAEYSAESFRMKPRLNGLMAELAGLSFIEDLAMVDSEIPYLLLVGGNIAAAVCYETVPESENLYLLHIRMDMPYDEAAAGMTAEEFCRDFNASELFTRSYVTKAAPEFFELEGTKEYISFHICMPEGERFLSRAVYETMFMNLSGIADNPALSGS